jgi:outer membrane protein TolC
VRAVLPIALLLTASVVQAQPYMSAPPQAPAAAAAPRAPAAGSASPFLGGVPSGTATTDTLSLTIIDAINRALDHNLGVLNAQQAVERARGARWIALADLLPNVNGRVAETRQVLNLAAFGFPIVPGIPAVVGPFNVFDARLFASQTVLDLGAWNGARAERHNLAAAEYSVKSARDLVVLVAANLYLQSLAAGARAEAARAQMQTAEAIYRQASDLKANGLVPGIDVLRAEVQLATDRQRTTAGQNDFEKAKLQLARVIGLPTGQPFTLVDELPNVPVPEMTLETALERAYVARPDYQAALERVRAAESERKSIIGDALPSIRLNADYGSLGQTVAAAANTFTVVGALNVPIFQGGRTRGRLIEADADLKNRRQEAEDLKASIYYDVRTAFLDLQASSEQLQAATRGRELAAEQLTQARDRFAAGVTNNVEVVQAQAAVAVSSEQYISALYSYNVAKALLARGLGVAEEATRIYLGGVR